MLIERSHIPHKMGIRDRLGFIKAAFGGGLPNNSLLKMATKFMPMFGEPPRRSTEDWIELYNKSPRMNPIHQIASDVATSAYGIYKENDAKKIRMTGSPVEKLLKKPNPNEFMTEYALFYITQVYLLLPSGEAFWIKERNGLGKPTELWPVPPNWVSEIPSIAKPFFTIYPQGNMSASPLYVPPRDMVYLKKPDVFNPYLRGVGRAEGIGDELETDEYMAKYAKRFFFNGAIPPMVGMMPGADEAVVNRTEEYWQQKYGGYNNAHKVAWLNWDAKIQILKETNKDMDFIESRKYLRDVANQHFSIPPELFGILENSNRSTIDAAYYLYTKNVLRKELKFIDDALNIQLVPEFGGGIYLEHDNVVPEDDEFKLKKASEGLKNGGLLVDEWRRANGWEELPNGKGKILYTPLNMIPTTMTGELMITEEQKSYFKSILGITELPPPEKELKKNITPKMKEHMWLVLDKAAVKNERLFTSMLKRYFQEQQDQINIALSKGAKAITDKPEELLNWTEEEIKLGKKMMPLWESSFKEGFEAANDMIGFGLNFEIVQPKFREWVERYGAEDVKGINNTTKDKLRKTLTEGIDEGESIPKLRDRVSEVMGEAKRSRAEKIARTETHNTVGAGTQETYAAAQVQQKEWLTAIDGRERESHAAINGEVVGMDQPFSNGLMFPGDASGDAAEVVNCRCTLLPVLATGEIPVRPEIVDIEMPDGSIRQATVEMHGDTRIVTPTDLDREKQLLSTDDVKRYIDQMPAEYRSEIKEVRLLDQSLQEAVSSNDPMAEFLRQQGVDVQDNVTAAYDLANKDISFYKNNHFKFDDFDEHLAGTMRHETAHALEDNLGDAFIREWQAAADADGFAISRYAETDIHEDFAETMKQWWSPKYSDREEVQFVYENRANVLEKYGIKPSGPTGKGL